MQNSLVCIVLYILPSYGVSAIQLPAGVKIDRDVVIAGIIAKFTVTPAFRALPNDARTTLLKQVDAQRVARMTLPLSIRARSTQDAAFVLRHLVFSIRPKATTNVEYLQLAIQKSCLDVVLHCETSRNLPHLSQRESKELRLGVEYVLGEARRAIHESFPGVFTMAEIDGALGRKRSLWTRRIEDPRTYAMKKVMSRQELASIVASAQVSMEKKQAAIRARLSRRALATRGASKKAIEVIAQHARREMLNKLLRPYGKGLHRGSSPAKLRTMRVDADDVVPGYSEVERKWTAMQKRLRMSELGPRIARTVNENRLRRADIDPKRELEEILSRGLGEDDAAAAETTGSMNGPETEENQPVAVSVAKVSVGEPRPQKSATVGVMLWMSLGVTCICIVAVMTVLRVRRAGHSK